MLNRLMYEHYGTATKEFMEKLMKAISKEYDVDYESMLEKIEEILTDEDSYKEIEFLCDAEYQEDIKCSIDFECTLVESDEVWFCIELHKFVEQAIADIECSQGK